jgi:hypothetical protein
VTLWPEPASEIASALPAMPAPTMTTSGLLSEGIIGLRPVFHLTANGD